MAAVFIVGCGYVGRRLARRLRGQGKHVLALARSAQTASRLQALGIETVNGDLDEATRLDELPVAGTGLYYFAPPPAQGQSDTRMAAFCAALRAPRLPRRVVLISTTGVYGDCGGQWIDESRPVAPQVDRARRRVDAEQQLQAWSRATGVPVVILRVAGIYGPGKLPEARLRAAEPVLRESESPYSNRIHVDDLVETCAAAMTRGAPGAIYNVTDGHPTTMTDFFNRVADALDLPRPPAIGVNEARRQLGEGMLSYLAESKRIDNRRLREELGVALRYPQLASGLAAAVREQRQAVPA